MRTCITIGMVLLTGAFAWSAESVGKVYPLSPGAKGKRMRSGYVQVRLVKGVGEIPFCTASGKLRFKLNKKTVFVDADDDGKFAKTESVQPGKPATVKVKVAGKPYDYPLIVYGSGTRLMVTSMAFLEAQVGNLPVRVVDGNCNGQFGDVQTAQKKGDMLAVGDNSFSPFGKYASIGGAVQQVDVLENGASLKLTPYTGPTSNLSVSVGEGYTLVGQLLNKENGFLVDLKGGETAAALPGAYKVTRVKLTTAPTAGAKTPPKVMLYGGGTELVLKPGENKLAFGLPLKLDFKAVRTAKGISVKEVNLVGSAGEGYRAYNYGARKSCKLETSLRAGSQTAPGAKLSYG